MSDAPSTPEESPTVFITPEQAMQLHAEVCSKGNLAFWTVTTKTSDFPSGFVVRPHVVFFGHPTAGQAPVPQRYVMVAETLAELRKKLPPGLHCTPRTDQDDPVVVECWF